jgi:hypothetical protein
MGASWRETLIAELRALRANDPVKLLSMYRHLKGLGVENQLPPHVSFTGMIDAIVEDEPRRQQSADPPEEMTE